MFGQDQINLLLFDSLLDEFNEFVATLQHKVELRERRAVEAAKENGMKVVALTGKDGGKLAGVCDVEIRAPYSEYADRAQEIHIKVIHCLIDGLESLVL